MRMPDQVELLLKLHTLEKNRNGANTTQAMRNIEENLDSSILKQYKKLKKRKGTGVAVLDKGACSECRMVYPETHDMLRYENCIYRCEYCGRIFVVTNKQN